MNSEVTTFLDELNHPLRAEIEQLRQIILESVNGLEENIKWNGPNYTFNEEDRVTMKIQPPRQIQLIFHRGAKKLEQPKDKLIQTNAKKLLWKENDRAIMAYKTMEDIKTGSSELTDLVQKWIEATK